MARTTRLLELLQLLRGRTRAVRAGELAQALGISERTIYRDVAELIALGAPISGEAGVGYVLRPGLFMPPLMLTSEETEAIALGLRYVDQRGDGPLKASAASALAKIATMLPNAVQSALTDPTILPGPSRQAFPKEAVDLDVLRSAIRHQTKLHIAYTNADGATTSRVLWPLALGFMDHARALVAWCELRHGYRVFRTDRIDTAELLAETYAGRRGTHLRKWREQVSGSGGFSPDRN